MAELDWGDVQGTILRGYRVDLARHLVLRVEDAARVRAQLGSLVEGGSGLPQVTTAAPWQEKPSSFLNVAITYQGLVALGVPSDALASFPRAFPRGATDPRTAALVGDEGDSDPSRWVGGLSEGADVHLILSVWVPKEQEVLEGVSRTLRAAFADAARELSSHDAVALPGDMVHFGYRDSIAQPFVEGAPPMKHPAPDCQPVVPAGAFLLGHPNQNGGTYRVQPEELSTNSSFAAFRILEQDVAGFEAFLTNGAQSSASIASCWQPRSAAAGGTACPSASPPTPRSRRSGTTRSTPLTTSGPTPPSTTPSATGAPSGPTSAGPTPGVRRWWAAAATSTGSSGGPCRTGRPTTPADRTACRVA